MPDMNLKSFGRFYFRTEVMSENLTSEIFCSPNFFTVRKLLFSVLKNHNTILTVSTRNRNWRRPHHRCRFFLLVHADLGDAYCLTLFQLLDSSSLLVSSDVQGLLPLQKQIPDEDPFKNIRITQ